MGAYTARLSLETRGVDHALDITRDVREAVRRSQLAIGAVTVFVPGSTAGVTTIEYEPGALADLAEAMERLAPRNGRYRHNERWGDGNGFSHVRAALLGPSLSVPFIDGEVQLGTWQQIIVVDFDNRPRSRVVLVQVVGDRQA